MNIWNKKTQNVSSAIPETHQKYVSISFLFQFHSILINWLMFRRLTSDCFHPVGIPSSGALFSWDFRILRHLQMWNNIKIIGRWFRKVTNMNVAFRWISPYFQFFLFEWRLADLSFCWHSNFRCPFFMWFSDSATLADVKWQKNYWPMIPESYKYECSISLVFIVFSVFLAWVTSRRLALEYCHSAGILTSGAFFWCHFRNLRDLQMWSNIQIVGQWFRKVIKINIAFRWFSAFWNFLFFLQTFRRLTLEWCHSAGIPSSGALFWFDFRNLRHL